MTEFTDDLGRIADCGVVAVLRGITDETVLDVANALVAGGVTVVEVTADTPGVLAKIETLADAYADDDRVMVGAGTVLDSATARATLLAGAEFVVTPTFDEAVVRTCNRYGATVLPGVFTPTEALRAFEAGADAVKVFPASSAGPGHLRSIAGPLSQIPLIPTGGVSLENASDYVEAGAVAVGVGSALVSDELVERGDYDALTARASEFVDVVAEAKSRSG